MMLYSVRWTISRTESGVEADSFFQALGYVVADALEDERPLNLPVSADPVVTAATDYTRAHLDCVAVSDVTRAAGVSERTLRRIFNTHLGMSWRSYLLRARVLRSMALLSQPDRSVLEVSIAVGFDDVGAFARSFARHCGETPLRLQTTNQWNTLNRPRLPQRPRQLRTTTTTPAAHPRWTRGPHLKCEVPVSNYPQVLTIAPADASWLPRATITVC